MVTEVALGPNPARANLTDQAGAKSAAAKSNVGEIFHDVSLDTAHDQSKLPEDTPAAASPSPAGATDQPAADSSLKAAVATPAAPAPSAPAQKGEEVAAPAPSAAANASAQQAKQLVSEMYQAIRKGDQVQAKMLAEEVKQEVHRTNAQENMTAKPQAADVDKLYVAIKHWDEQQPHEKAAAAGTTAAGATAAGAAAASGPAASGQAAAAEDTAAAVPHAPATAKAPAAATAAQGNAVAAEDTSATVLPPPADGQPIAGASAQAASGASVTGSTGAAANGSSTEVPEDQHGTDDPEPHPVDEQPEGADGGKEAGGNGTWKDLADHHKWLRLYKAMMRGNLDAAIKLAQKISTYLNHRLAEELRNYADELCEALRHRKLPKAYFLVRKINAAVEKAKSTEEKTFHHDESKIHSKEELLRRLRESIKSGNVHMAHEVAIRLRAKLEKDRSRKHGKKVIHFEDVGRLYRAIRHGNVPKIRKLEDVTLTLAATMLSDFSMLFGAVRRGSLTRARELADRILFFMLRVVKRAHSSAPERLGRALHKGNMSAAIGVTGRMIDQEMTLLGRALKLGDEDVANAIEGKLWKGESGGLMVLLEALEGANLETARTIAATLEDEDELRDMPLKPEKPPDVDLPEAKTFLDESKQEAHTMDDVDKLGQVSRDGDMKAADQLAKQLKGELDSEHINVSQGNLDQLDNEVTSGNLSEARQTVQRFQADAKASIGNRDKAAYWYIARLYRAICDKDLATAQRLVPLIKVVGESGLQDMARFYDSEEQGNLTGIRTHADQVVNFMLRILRKVVNEPIEEFHSALEMRNISQARIALDHVLAKELSMLNHAVKAGNKQKAEDVVEYLFDTESASIMEVYRALKAGNLDDVSDIMALLEEEPEFPRHLAYTMGVGEKVGPNPRGVLVAALGNGSLGIAGSAVEQMMQGELDRLSNAIKAGQRELANNISEGLIGSDLTGITSLYEAIKNGDWAMAKDLLAGTLKALPSAPKSNTSAELPKAAGSPIDALRKALVLGDANLARRWAAKIIDQEIAQMSKDIKEGNSHEAEDNADELFGSDSGGMMSVYQALKRGNIPLASKVLSTVKRAGHYSPSEGGRFTHEDLSGLAGSGGPPQQPPQEPIATGGAKGVEVKIGHATANVNLAGDLEEVEKAIQSGDQKIALSWATKFEDDLTLQSNTTEDMEDVKLEVDHLVSALFSGDLARAQESLAKVRLLLAKAQNPGVPSSKLGPPPQHVVPQPPVGKPVQAQNPAVPASRLGPPPQHVAPQPPASQPVQASLQESLLEQFSLVSDVREKVEADGDDAPDDAHPAAANLEEASGAAVRQIAELRKEANKFLNAPGEVPSNPGEVVLSADSQAKHGDDVPKSNPGEVVDTADQEAALAALPTAAAPQASVQDNDVALHKVYEALMAGDLPIARKWVAVIPLDYLISRGANKHDCQLMYIAISDGDQTAARKFVIKIKRDLDHPVDEVASNDTSKLYMAIQDGNVPESKRLIIRVKQDMKDDPKKVNQSGLEELYAAVMDGDMVTARRLIDKVWLELGMEVAKAKENHFNKLQQAIQRGDLETAGVLASRVKEDMGNKSVQATKQGSSNDEALEANAKKREEVEKILGDVNEDPKLKADTLRGWKSEAQAAAEARGMEEQYDPNPEQAKKEIKQLVEAVGYGAMTKANKLIVDIKLHVPGIEGHEKVASFFKAVKLSQVVLARELGNQVVFIMMQLADQASMKNVLVTNVDETSGVAADYDARKAAAGSAAAAGARSAVGGAPAPGLAGAPAAAPGLQPVQVGAPAAAPEGTAGQGQLIPNPEEAKRVIQKLVETIGHGDMGESRSLIADLKRLVPGIEDHAEVAELFNAVQIGNAADASELANKYVFLMLRLADQAKPLPVGVPAPQPREVPMGQVKEHVQSNPVAILSAATKENGADKARGPPTTVNGTVVTTEKDTAVNASSVKKEIDVNHLNEEAHEALFLLDDAIKRGDIEAVRRLGRRSRVIVALKTLQDSNFSLNVTPPSAHGNGTGAGARGAGEEVEATGVAGGMGNGTAARAIGDGTTEERAIAAAASAMPATAMRECKVNVTGDPEEVLQQLRACTDKLGQFAKVVEGGRLQSRNSNDALREELNQVSLLFAKLADRRPVDVAFSHDQEHATQFLLGELNKTDTEIAKMKTDY